MSIVDQSIREELSRPESVFDAEHTLALDAGRTMFERRWLGPREIVASQAFDLLRRDTHLIESAPEELVARYRDHVAEETRRFARQPVTDPPHEAAARQFLRSIGSCFGIHDYLAEPLLLEFMELEVDERLSILLELQESYAFSWLAEVVEEADFPESSHSSMGVLRKLIASLPIDDRRERRRKRRRF